MTEKLELYKCQICGNLVQVILPGFGELVCCNEKMEKLIPKENDNTEASEKHIPEIYKEENSRFVKLIHHPMNNEHYIQFIEAYNNDKTKMILQYFNPDEKAEMEITGFAENIEALENCNIHGLWRNKNDN